MIRSPQPKVEQGKTGMSAEGKDSAEVVKFMSLFAQLKDYCDDVPEEISNLAATDPAVKYHCDQLYYAAQLLQMNETLARPFFAAPVDTVFRAAWRDYEERYETVVGEVYLAEILELLPNVGEPSQTPTRPDGAGVH